MSYLDKKAVISIIGLIVLGLVISLASLTKGDIT
jgi:hypothetical protein